MDRIPEKIDSKYRYVLLASQRAEQLIQGAQAKTEVDSPKHTEMGMQEITEGAVEWGYGPAVEPEEGDAEPESQDEAGPEVD